MPVQSHVRNSSPQIATHPWRDLGLVAACALGVRLVFLAITADTYDYDEFVLLFLARGLAHGAVPYHDFMFFHPPGVLVMLRAVEPLTSLWWPWARILTVIVDTGTAVLVWRIGVRLFDLRTGVIAGLLYALSPLALISATRVGQDPIITALGVLGLYFLLTRSSWTWAAVAGICLGLAIWVKYPAAYFIPIYILAAPRRALTILLSAALTLLACTLPFREHWSALYQQTVSFQQTRWTMAVTQRWETTVLFWLVVNSPGVAALAFVSVPAWLTVGFGLGGAFVLASQVYYHYFVPVVPFAALLAAPLLARLGRRGIASLVAIGLTLAMLWGIVIERGGSSPLYVTAAHLSDIAPTVDLLRRNTTPGDAVLADRLEYAYLSNRQALAYYFWNVGVLVDAQYLERRLDDVRAVVLSYGASSGYPAGVTGYLNAHYSRTNTRATTVWWLPGSGRSIPAGE